MKKVELKKLVLDYLAGQLSIQEFAAQHRCSEKRVHQIIRQTALAATGNRSCRDFSLIAFGLARQEYVSNDTSMPQGFFRHEIDARALESNAKVIVKSATK